MEFLGTRPWIAVSVRHDPGEELVLGGAVLLVVGLLGSLAGRRRRIFFRVTRGRGARRVVCRAPTTPGSPRSSRRSCARHGRGPDRMASLSDQLLVVTILAYLAAMLCYAAEYAFGTRGVVARRARTRDLVAVGRRGFVRRAVPTRPSSRRHRRPSRTRGSDAVRARRPSSLTVLGVARPRGDAGDPGGRRRPGAVGQPVRVRARADASSARSRGWWCCGCGRRCGRSACSSPRCWCCCWAPPAWSTPRPARWCRRSTRTG